MESKFEIDGMIPNSVKPRTILVLPNTDPATISKMLEDAHLSYPLIVKPDIGMQGKAVLKVHSAEKLMAAVPCFTVPFLLQEWIDLPQEMGLFYVRMPGEEKGKITGIVQKEFLQVTGDGRHSVKELIELDPRAKLQLSVLKKSLGEKINEVLPPNENLMLVPYGNHARGSLFLDYSNKIDEELTNNINSVCRQIPDFHYGRLDIRYRNWEDFRKNKNWCIIELNGAGSEPTHMYDPQHSIFFAWKEIIRHWHLLYLVSKKNKKRGFPPLRFQDGKKMFKENQSYVKKLDEIAEKLNHV
jgi:hypothetical protein